MNTNTNSNIKQATLIKMVQSNPSLSAIDKSVMTAHINLMSSNGVCGLVHTNNLPTIARTANVAYRSVQRANERLQALGMIGISGNKDRSFGGSTNFYLLTMLNRGN